MLANIPVWN